MKEIWKSVVGLESLYEVSNCGRVRSIDRTIILKRKEGPRPFRYRGKLLKQTSASHGYPTVRFPFSGACVHTLVLEAFVGPRPDKMECLHKDGNKANSRLSNLSWGTRSQNMMDAIAHGTIPKGESHVHAKLTDEIVRTIRASTDSDRVLASIFNVDSETVRRSRRRESWRHVL